MTKKRALDLISTNSRYYIKYYKEERIYVIYECTFNYILDKDQVEIRLLESNEIIEVSRTKIQKHVLYKTKGAAEVYLKYYYGDIKTHEDKNIIYK